LPPVLFTGKNLQKKKKKASEDRMYVKKTEEKLHKTIFCRAA